jgi:hypothetical protein
VLAGVGSSSLAGCTTEAACFSNCEGIDGNVGGASSGGSGGSAGSLNIGLGGDSDGPSLGGGQNRAGTGGLEDAGSACDGVDLKTDLNNCGQCGNVCIFTGADAMCVDGECVMGECRDARYDLDSDPNNGCEYACAPAADDTELCNYVDDDCDGVIDNGFDLTTDSQNCGVCGRACSLLHADSECRPGADAPSCVVTECEPGWHDIDGVDQNGCEYECVKSGRDGVPCAPNDASCGQELCDNADNDCNGVINDGNEQNGGPEGGTACDDYCPGQNCVGECTSGVRTCVGEDLVCVPGKGPQLETCDGEDNDCDGTDDNGFDLTSDPLNCGACGASCLDALPNAVAECKVPAGAASPACAIKVCKSGYKDLDPNTPGCEQCPKFPTSAETCNGIDDDCDGVVDNAAAIAAQKPAVNAFCNNGRNIAATPCAGTTVECGGASGWTCKYPTGTGVEIDATTKKVRIVENKCDNVDGNCDGQKDEAFLNKGASCAAGKGICARTATYVCSANGSGTECSASAVATDARDELCNGLDDNCDGQVDERTPVAGSQCYGSGSAKACLGYTEPMVKVGNTWVYTYEASRPDATSTDPGIYDVRACSRAGVLPWTSIKQTEAAAACAAVPTSVTGTKMRLCTEAEWQTACLAGAAAGSTRWSYSTTPGTYDDLVCNDAAAAVSGPWTTAFNNGQSQRCHCRVRGGSYLSQGPATACNFSFVLNIPTFVNADLGFRCCSDVAP